MRWLGLALALGLVAPAAEARPRKKRPAPRPAPAAAAPAPAAEEDRAPATRRGASEPPATTRGDVVRRESRIEFDERLVQGQTAAGAVYLFQRAEGELRSMIAVPQSFRDRTMRTIYPEVASGRAARR